MRAFNIGKVARENLFLDILPKDGSSYKQVRTENLECPKWIVKLLQKCYINIKDFEKKIILINFKLIYQRMKYNYYCEIIKREKESNNFCMHCLYEFC